MAIRIEQNLFYVESKGLSLILENRDGYLMLKHLGRPIPSYHFSNTVHEKDHAFSGNPTPDHRTFSLDTQRQILGQHGLGDFRKPSIQIQHGATEVTDFLYVGANIYSGSVEATGLPNPHTVDSAETLALVFEDNQAALRLTLYYTAYEDRATITSFSKIENCSDETVVIHKALSVLADVPAGDYDVITLQGAYAREKTVRRQQVEQGIFSISSNRGASGHAQTPALILADHEVTEDAGSALAFQLLYSGNFEGFVQKNQLNEVRVGLGINPENFAWELAPNQSFDTPVAMISYSHKGLTGLSQESQAFVQDHIIPSQFAHKERPILINNWEATYFDFNEEKILKIAEQAQKLGIEMLVLDDGWFGKREDDNSGLGDWFVNEKKMNGSMAQLAEKIHRMGMKFGLWFEPEMISEDSDLYRAHPDWAFAIPGRVPNHSRNQLVLDMTREDVREYLLERLTTIVHDAKIDYVKWDMNRSVCDVYSHVAAQNRNGELYHRYVLGVYDLLERFLAACPDLLLEGCSGGGGRYDAGMMYYSPQIWCSDNTDAINRLSIQYGSSFFYPISTVGSHVSVCPNHQTGRVTPFRTRGDVALAGSFGYEMDLNKISEEEKEMVKEQVAAMHEYYELTHEGLYYRLTGLKKQDFMAWEFVAKDQSRALLTIVKTDAEGNMLPVHTKVCGLAEDKLYRCSLDQEVRLGRTWNRAGLTLHQVLEEYESIRVEFTEVK